MREAYVDFIIKTVDDPELRRPARAVRKFNQALRDLVEGMARAMYAANGVGLAAPQVGVSRSVVVVDAGDGLLELVNPVITGAGGTEQAWEGCLSVPGVLALIERSQTVQVAGQDPHGRSVWVEADGLKARALQHELDHLNGVVILDRAIELKEDTPEEAGEAAEAGAEEPPAGPAEEEIP